MYGKIEYEEEGEKTLHFLHLRLSIVMYMHCSAYRLSCYTCVSHYYRIICRLQVTILRHAPAVIKGSSAMIVFIILSPCMSKNSIVNVTCILAVRFINVRQNYSFFCIIFKMSLSNSSVRSTNFSSIYFGNYFWKKLRALTRFVLASLHRPELLFLTRLIRTVEITATKREFLHSISSCR
jgi:hypothetical protein